MLFKQIRAQHIYTRTIVHFIISRRMSTFVGSGSLAKVNKPCPTGYKLIQEGCASILYGEQNEAFYNKVQVFNRDMSILVIKMFDELRRKDHDEKEAQRLEKWRKKNEMEGRNTEALPAVDLNILEALSATGLRSVRYWKEIPNVRRIIANDIVPDAVEVIRRNIAYNDISENCVVPHLADATAYMHELAAEGRAGRRQSNVDDFHVVDLDPYGGANPFLDSAVQCVAEGGLLCVTCTDMAVLAGQQPGACFAKYGALPIRIRSCHEQALRILLGSIQHHCSRYGRYIVPLVSLSIDFYVRVFVRVFTSQNEVKTAWKKYSNVIVCNGCEGLQFQRLGDKLPPSSGKCSECGSNQKVSGPIWSDPIHDPAFVQTCIDHVNVNKDLFTTHKRILGMLTVVAKEIPDAPLYYVHGQISSKLKINSPPIVTIRSAILNCGYKCSQTHCKGDAIKTNAPVNVMFDIFREWHRQHAQEAEKGKTAKKRKEEEKDEEMDGEEENHEDVQKSATLNEILRSKQSTTTVNFALREEAKGTKDALGVPSFLPNPEENWGPGKRARGHKRSRDEVKEKAEEKIEPTDSPDSKQAKKQH
jgi:tRNA (guanine26-N2/guanine27-N2)-dimethyltransferase